MNQYMDFLNASLPHCRAMLTGMDEEEEVLYDWLQASWEMLVESKMFYGTKNYLPIYGQGADLGINNSSRVSSPTVAPTHKVVCSGQQPVYDVLSRNKIDVNNFEFEEFVSLDDDWYSLENTLTHVLISQHDNEYVVSFDEIDFELREYKTKGSVTNNTTSSSFY